MNHLLRTGRTRIAHITGPQRHVLARLRDEGGRRALAPYAEDFVGGTAWGEWSEAWGRDAAHILLRSGEAFDAIFCGSDQIARGVAEAPRESGLDIPGDVALLGFDNWEPMAVGARPPLTTVDPQLVPLGRMAASRLLAMIESGMPESGRILSPCDLVIRQSTGAATRRTWGVELAAAVDLEAAVTGAPSSRTTSPCKQHLTKGTRQSPAMPSRAPAANVGAGRLPSPVTQYSGWLR